MTWDIRLHALILLGTVIGLCIAVVWAMCVVASEADDAMDREAQERLAAHNARPHGNVDRFPGW